MEHVQFVHAYVQHIRTTYSYFVSNTQKLFLKRMKTVLTSKILTWGAPGVKRQRRLIRIWLLVSAWRHPMPSCFQRRNSLVHFLVHVFDGSHEGGDDVIPSDVVGLQAWLIGHRDQEATPLLRMAPVTTGWRWAAKEATEGSRATSLTSQRRAEITKEACQICHLTFVGRSGFIEYLGNRDLSLWGKH